MELSNLGLFWAGVIAVSILVYVILGLFWAGVIVCWFSVKWRAVVPR